MGKFDKQLKYSIRKVSVGAASVVIGALYLAMGAGVVHAETNTTTDGGASHPSPSPEPETSQPNSLTSSSYGAEPAQNPDASGKSTESTTLCNNFNSNLRMISLSLKNLSEPTRRH